MNLLITPEIIAKLAACDSCSIANGVDASHVRLANEGFTDNRISCWTPRLTPMVGTVTTLKVRSAQPPMKSAFYLEQADWWERLEKGTSPRVLVIEDLDAHPGRGSLVGPVHACILKAMGFVGVVTNGAIRGRSRFEELNLHAFAGNLAPSHAYSHVVEVGAPVEVAGLRLQSGDLVHGDESGVVLIPAGLAEAVATQAAAFQEREKRLCELCNSSDFSPEILRRNIGVDTSRR